jgi:hypothetical protein
MPEALALRSLDLEISNSVEWLEDEAREILALPARTIGGAIAKIELGLRVQGPYDWRDNARELAEQGLSELRILRTQIESAGTSSVR